MISILAVDTWIGAALLLAIPATVVAVRKRHTLLVGAARIFGRALAACGQRAGSSGETTAFTDSLPERHLLLGPVFCIHSPDEEGHELDCDTNEICGVPGSVVCANYSCAGDDEAQYMLLRDGTKFDWSEINEALFDLEDSPKRGTSTFDPVFACALRFHHMHNEDKPCPSQVLRCTELFHELAGPDNDYSVNSNVPLTAVQCYLEACAETPTPLNHQQMYTEWFLSGLESQCTVPADVRKGGPRTLGALLDVIR